ncbi:MAG: hypothetical protein MRY57_04075 [Candidatus Pacebacteria bacterium]|nr:hypothetical protein [Candidatus Paceibacterota bacterium]
MENPFKKNKSHEKKVTLSDTKQRTAQNNRDAKRPRIEKKTQEKVWDGRHAASQETYGRKKFKDIENLKVRKRLRFDWKPGYFKGLSTKKLKEVFEETRQRVVKKAMAANPTFFDKKSRKMYRENFDRARADYNNSYAPQAYDLEKRGVLPEKNNEVNAPEQTREEYIQENAENFADGIVSAIEEKQEQEMHQFRESLGQNDEGFIELENDAKEKFQAMNAAIRESGKDSDEYFEAHSEWMNARAKVEAHEASYRNEETTEE